MSDATATPDAPALPGDGLRESIVDDLRRHIGDGLVEFVLKPQDDLWIRVAADRWADTGRALRAMGFEYFCFLSGLDWKPSPFGRGEDDPTEPPPERRTEIVQGVAGGETRFQVLARVTDIRRHVGVTIKADVDEANPSIESWHAIYAGANWHERETHEMFGIGFDGHPDLRNMYLPTEFEGYPLRKDFPLLARIVKPWPGIVDVEPMPAEEADAPADGDSAPAENTPEAAPEMVTDPSTVTTETADDAPAHETPADDAVAEADVEAPDTVVAEQAAADVAPVAAAAADDVAAEPEAEVESVTGTAEEVEAVAEAAAAEARQADDVAAEADVEPSVSADVPDSGRSADTNEVDGSVSADVPESGRSADPNQGESAPGGQVNDD